jgi:hypothetical protein
VIRWLPPLLAAVACGGKATPRPPIDPGTGSVARLDRDLVENELRVAILDGYRLLAQGYDNVYIDGVARDDKLLLFDVGPEDIVVGEPARAAAVRALFPGEDFEIVSKDLEVRLSQDGSCAWTYDDLSTRVVRDGRRAIFPLRATTLYERREARWVKVLEHVSYASTLEEAGARGLLLDVKLIDDAPQGEAGARVRDRVASLLASAPRGAIAADARLVAYDARVIEGAAAAELPTVRALFGPDYSVEPAGLRVVLSTTGSVAWAAALATVRGPAGTFTARATWVLEQRDGELRVVQTHVSVPIPDADLAAAAWGVTVQTEAPAGPG